MSVARKKAEDVDPNFIYAVNPRSPEEWISNRIWKQYCAIWKSASWQEKSAKASSNRAKTQKRINSTQGSHNYVQVKNKMAKKLGRLPCQSEFFDETHKYKKGEKMHSWTTPQCEVYHEDYMQRLQNLNQDLSASTDGQPPEFYTLDPDARIWTDMVGRSRGRVTGIGHCPALTSPFCNDVSTQQPGKMEMLEKEVAYHRESQSKMQAWILYMFNAQRTGNTAAMPDFSQYPPGYTPPQDPQQQHDKEDPQQHQEDREHQDGDSADVEGDQDGEERID